MLKIIAFLAMVSANSSYDTSFIDRKELMCLSKAVYHESRGESIEGQMAVAHVVLNRARDKRYPWGVCNVVYQPNQFSGIKYARPDYNSNAWERSIEVATFAILDITDDPTNGATHYYAHKKVKPRWKNSLDFAIRIGNHTFLR